MELAHPRDFQRVRPYGNQGDLKCDGYLGSKQTVFQVYAPRSIRRDPLVRKIRADFEGALHHWAALMQTWVLVHNDFDGLPGEALQLIQDLGRGDVGVRTAIWGPRDIQSVVLALAPEDLTALLGPALTSRNFDELRFDRLRPILLNIKRQQPPPEISINPVSPEKLSANAFSADVVQLLRWGRRKEPLVEALLTGWTDPTFGESLAEGFRSKYAELKCAGLTPDEIFGEIQSFAGGSEVSRDAGHQAAVLAVMSYFFERCDIFEDRKSEPEP